jgi:hypothetical protein
MQTITIPIYWDFIICHRWRKTGPKRKQNQNEADGGVSIN